MQALYLQGFGMINAMVNVLLLCEYRRMKTTPINYIKRYLSPIKNPTIYILICVIGLGYFSYQDSLMENEKAKITNGPEIGRYALYEGGNWDNLLADNFASKDACLIARKNMIASLKSSELRIKCIHLGESN